MNNTNFMNLEIYIISNGKSVDVRTLNESDSEYYKEYMLKYTPSYSKLYITYSESSKASLVTKLNNNDYNLLQNYIIKINEKLVLYFKKILLISDVLLPYKNIKNMYRCSLCKKSGHNKRTCRK